MAGTAERFTPRPIRRGPLAGRGPIAGIAGLSAIATGASAVLLGLGTSQLDLPLVTSTPWVSAAGGDGVPAGPGGLAGRGTPPGQPGVPGPQTGVIVIPPGGQLPGGSAGGGSGRPGGGNVGRPPVSQTPDRRSPSGDWPSDPIPPIPPPHSGGFDIDLGWIKIHIPTPFSAAADSQSSLRSAAMAPEQGPLAEPVALPSNACDAPHLLPLQRPPSEDSAPPVDLPAGGLPGIVPPPTGQPDPTGKPYEGRHRVPTQPTPGRHRVPEKPSGVGTAPAPQPSGTWNTPPTSTPPTSEPEPSAPPASEPPQSNETSPAATSSDPAPAPSTTP